MTRGLVRRRRKGLIAPAASSAPANAGLHSSLAEVLQKQFQLGIVNKRSGRNLYYKVPAVCAVLIAA